MVSKNEKNSKKKDVKVKENAEKQVENKEVNTLTDEEKKELRKLKEAKAKENIRNFFKNRLVLAVIAVILSFGVVFGTEMVANKLLKEQVTVYSLKKNVTKGNLITDDLVSSRKVSRLGLLKDTVTEKSEIIGKYALYDVYEGDIIRASKIGSERPYEYAYLSELGNDEYAYTIRIDESRNALSSRIRSGDVVTIIAIDNESQDNRDKAVIPDELKYIEVMAVINAEMSDVKDKKDIDTNNDITSIIVKARGNEQLCRLAEANSKSDISIALVCRDDDEKKEELLYKYISRPQEEQEEHSNIEDETNYNTDNFDNTVIEEDIINDKENDSSMGQ